MNRLIIFQPPLSLPTGNALALFPRMPHIRSVLGLGATALGFFLIAKARRTFEDYDFHGRAVLITGGSRGLGLVLARQLAAKGARLTLVARDGDELERAVENIHRDHPDAEVLAVKADLRQPDSAERAVAESVTCYGRLDVLINNAGIIQVGPLDHMALEDFEEAMKMHFWAPLHMVLAALPEMRRQHEGRIVNISSIGGKVSIPHMLPYSASKFALTGLSEGLRIALAEEHITVTTVCPGLMRTGSPVNATFKGRHTREYAWFAVADSLPIATIGAERAARQILAACRRGDAELVITVPAKVLALAHTLAPEFVSDALTLVNRLLPSAAGDQGDHARRGVDSESWATARLAGLAYAAAHRNNEL